MNRAREICGWNGKRLTKRSDFHNWKSKLILGKSARFVSNQTWEVFLDPFRTEKLFAPIMNVRCRLVQRVDGDNVLFCYDHAASCVLSEKTDIPSVSTMALVTRVSTDQLIAEVTALLGKVKNDDLPDIKALFARELQMDLKETDVDARVLSYFQRFAEIVLKHGLEEVFSGIDGETEKCERLMSSLVPPVLKEDIKNAVRWTHKEANRSMQELYTLVYEKAVQHERHFQQNKRMRLMVRDKSTQSKSAKDTGKAAVQSKKAANTEPEKKKFKQTNAERKVEKKTDKKKEKQPASRKEPPSPCPKCQEMHWLSDCVQSKKISHEEIKKADAVHFPYCDD
ncbi:hypothetical protein PInf_017831 [Phytophthora infestans]|nr:hypothetical protein PInf_017831 [Phytophthora infestans]